MRRNRWMASVPLAVVVLGGLAFAAGPARADDRAAAVPTSTLPVLPPLPGSTLPPATLAPATIAPATSPATAAPPTAAPVTNVASTTATGSTAGAYQLVEDNTGLLSAEIPTAWNQVDTRPFINNDDTLRPAITATTAVNFDDFLDLYQYPGVIYEAFQPTTTPADVLADLQFADTCTDGGQTPYADELYTGTMQVWNFCGGASARTFILALTPTNGAFTAVIWAKTVTAEDEAHLSHVLATMTADLTVGLPTETAAPDTSTSVAPVTLAPVTTLASVPTPPATSAVSPTVPPVTTAVVPTVPPVTVAPVTAPPVTSGAPVVTTGGVAAGFQLVTDESGRVSVQVPVTWNQTDGRSTTTDDGLTFPALSASSNLEVFRESFAASGVFIREATYAADTAAVVSDYALGDLSTQCTVGPVAQVTGTSMSGAAQTFSDCGGSTYDFAVAALNPNDGRQTSALVFVQYSDAEVTALTTILNSVSIGPAV